jgi:Ca2+-binding RTX toxin-like protein
MTSTLPGKCLAQTAQGVATMPTQDINIIVDGKALVFSTDNQSWTVNCRIESEQNDAVFSSMDHSTLYNNGVIVSYAANGFAGVRFMGDYGQIYNWGQIAGSTGVDTWGAHEKIINGGDISGNNGVVFGPSSSYNYLQNGGSIYGINYGIIDYSTDGAFIKNYDSITSSGTAIDIETGVGAFTLIENEAGAKIAGNDYAIHTQTGRLSLFNTGLVQGDIVCDASNANDDIDNAGGTITGNVLLGSGDDSFIGIGGTVTGNIKGGAGDDWLTGGKGADDLFGGADADTFAFAYLPDIGKANHDEIHDFSEAQLDIIDLSLIDAKTNKAGNQAFHFIEGDAFSGKSGELRYANHLLQGDVNGDGKADFNIEVNVAHLHTFDFHL